MIGISCFKNDNVLSAEGARGGKLKKSIPCAVFFEKDHGPRREISKTKHLHRFLKKSKGFTKVSRRDAEYFLLFPSFFRCSTVILPIYILSNGAEIK